MMSSTSCGRFTVRYPSSDLSEWTELMRNRCRPGDPQNTEARRDHRPRNAGSGEEGGRDGEGGCVAEDRFGPAWNGQSPSGYILG